MDYKKDVKATYDNSFCMDSNCIYWFEDMCMRCMNEEGCEVFPDSTVYLDSRYSDSCKGFASGTNLYYLLTDEEIGGLNG